MSNRSWFFAAGDKQQGPYSEEQLRDFIAKGLVTADTFVWTEGMAAWQRAADVPGLLAGGSGPPAIPGSNSPLASDGSVGQPLSSDFGVWALFGRVLLLLVGILLIVPAPWVATSFYRWVATRVHVPQRPALAFTGKPGDIWYAFVLLGICSYGGVAPDSYWYLSLLLLPLEAFLSWMIVRWIVANISSEGRQLPLTLAGGPWSFIGWYLLLFISAITIIGWAWVMTAWLRSMFRHIHGTRRDVVFNGSGWQVLWRTLLYALGCALLIPIPWVIRWYGAWFVSQIAVVQRA